MSARSIGLQTYRWNNNLKSIGLLALYPFIVVAVVWACVYVSLYILSGGSAMGATPAMVQAQAQNMLLQWWPSIVAGVSIWFVIAYFFQTSMIRNLANSHAVTRKQEPALYNLLENLCISQGMPMPRLEIIETHARNAFASGVDKRTYTITVTRGLLRSLTQDEVEAVLAHELAHIINRDVRLLIVTIVFTGLFGFAAQMVWNIARITSHGTRRNNGAGLVLAGFAVAAILYIGYFATLWSRFALSRRREYDADAGAIAMTKNPEAMMRALMRISGRDQLPEHSADLALMCIENRQPFFGLFATHPPITERIQAISAMTNTPIPDLRPHQRADDDARFDAPAPDAAVQWRTIARRNPWRTPESR